MKYLSCSGVWKHCVKGDHGEVTKLFFKDGDNHIEMIFVDGVAESWREDKIPYRSIVSLRKMVIPEMIIKSIEVLYNTTQDSYYFNTREVPWDVKHTFTAFYDRIRFEKLKRIKNEFIAR